MLIAIIPLVVAIIGLLAYVLASNPKISEVGRILFLVGALVTVAVLAGHTLRMP